LKRRRPPGSHYRKVINARFKNLKCYLVFESLKKGVKNMEDKKIPEETPDEQENKKKKKTEEELPVCTSAPSAEHHRANEEDEPCDDGRAGNVD
jgi:hypothetical protein